MILIYRKLIKDMPRANQYLLLYVLDLLSVFARKADKNLMTESSGWLAPALLLILTLSQTWQ